MPNTLAHIGLQTPLTKIGFRDAPLQWIALGCIIPDIPWIVQRILTSVPGLDPIDLRLYAVTQASFLFCCILALAFSLLTRKSRFVFSILAANSLFHLLFDACQEKWANGVNLLAPFSWQLTHFDLFWPEHPITYLFIVMGLAVFLICWSKATRTDLLLQRPGAAKTVCLLLALLAYFAGPFLFLKMAYDADLHYSKTMTSRGERTGKEIAVDRGTYNKKTNSFACYADRELSFSNPPPVDSGTLSIQGHFATENRITITAYHAHSKHRDYASYAGLLLTLFLWLHSLLAQTIRKRSLRRPQ